MKEWKLRVLWALACGSSGILLSCSHRHYSQDLCDRSPAAKTASNPNCQIALAVESLDSLDVSMFNQSAEESFERIFQRGIQLEPFTLSLKQTYPAEARAVSLKGSHWLNAYAKELFESYDGLRLVLSPLTNISRGCSAAIINKNQVLLPLSIERSFRPEGSSVFVSYLDSKELFQSHISFRHEMDHAELDKVERSGVDHLLFGRFYSDLQPLGSKDSAYSDQLYLSELYTYARDLEQLGRELEMMSEPWRIDYKLKEIKQTNDVFKLVLLKIIKYIGEVSILASEAEYFTVSFKNERLNFRPKHEAYVFELPVFDSALKQKLLSQRGLQLQDQLHIRRQIGQVMLGRAQRITHMALSLKSFNDHLQILSTDSKPNSKLISQQIKAMMVDLQAWMSRP